MEKGVRQERKGYFKHDLQQLNQWVGVNDAMENCFVNGLPNKDIANDVIPNRIVHHTADRLQCIDTNNFAYYIKVELNNFIGNPK